MADAGVIFDMDGVLVDSYRAHLESWLKLAAEGGLDFTPEQFAESFGMTTREIILKYWPDRAAPAVVREWDDRKEQLYREIIRDEAPVMPGVGRLIRSLHEGGFALAIGSSGPAQNVAAVMSVIPESVFFDATVSCHDVSHGKPAPDIFLAAADKLALRPGDCLVIEDAQVGIAAARRAGMPVVALVGTSDRPALASADLVIDSLNELDPSTARRLIRANSQIARPERR
jgi:beta-phosphoglucomutase